MLPTIKADLPGTLLGLHLFPRDTKSLNNNNKGYIIRQ